MQAVAGDDSSEWLFSISGTVRVPVTIHDTVFIHALFTIHTYLCYSAWSLTRVHISFVIHLIQICIKYSIITVYVLPLGMVSMPAGGCELNGGFTTCLCYDSLYIRNIWLFVSLLNSGQYILSESESVSAVPNKCCIFFQYFSLKDTIGVKKPCFIQHATQWNY